VPGSAPVRAEIARGRRVLQNNRQPGVLRIGVDPSDNYNYKIISNYP